MKNNMNEKYIKNFCDELIIGTNNLKKQCIYFIDSIEKNTKEYKEKIEKEREEFNKFKNNNDKVIFTPENLLNASPITILDAPWGAGKTFFIESLCKYVLKDEIKLNYIKKIIVIDSWKYSISNAIPTDFILYLVDNLTKTLKLKDKVKKWFISFLNTIPLSVLNNTIGTSLEIKNNDLKDLNTDDIIKKLNKYIKEPVLIVIDNIERIGENGWEILKTIQRLAMLDNLIFLLPMNKDRLVSEKLSNSEWKIEKYINIPFYSFKQDYLGILKKYNFEDELSNIFNDLLSMQIDGECLSIRELEKILSRKDLKKESKNKYTGLLLLKKIWPLNEEIKKIIYEDLTSFLYIIDNIIEDITSFNNLFESNEYKNIRDEILNCVNSDIGLPTILSNSYFLKYLTKEKINWKLYKSYIENIENISFENKIKLIKKSICKFTKEKSKNQLLIEKIREKINNLDGFIRAYESGNVERTVENNEKYAFNKSEFNIQTMADNSYLEKNLDLDKKIKELEAEINRINVLNESLSEFKCKYTNYIKGMYDKYKTNIKSQKNMSIIFKTLIQNEEIWDKEDCDIDYVYECFINKLINS